MLTTSWAFQCSWLSGFRDVGDLQLTRPLPVRSLDGAAMWHPPHCGKALTTSPSTLTGRDPPFRRQGLRTQEGGAGPAPGRGPSARRGEAGSFWRPLMRPGDQSLAETALHWLLFSFVSPFRQNGAHVHTTASPPRSPGTAASRRARTASAGEAEQAGPGLGGDVKCSRYGQQCDGPSTITDGATLRPRFHFRVCPPTS